MKKKIFCILMSLCMIIPCAFMLTGCGHKHSASTEWSKDETHHWHSCTNGDDCTEKIDSAEHDWNEGEITTAPTCTEDGVKTFTCSVCSQTKTETLPASGHSFETEWSTNETHHWYAATCEHSTEEKDKSEHVFGEWTTKTAETCTSPEVEIRSCECGYSEERNGTPATGHSYSSEWSKDETHHWHQAICSHTSEISDKSVHDWNSGEILENATYSKVGKIRVTCTTCTYSKINDIQKLTEREQSAITNVQGLTKMYDGTPVANPSYDKIGDGQISFEWWQGQTKLISAPTNAGTYNVKVIMAQGTDYKATETVKEFVIMKVALNITNIEKIYDTTNTLTSPVSTDQGLINGDDVTFTATFEGVDAGSAMAAIPTLSGTDAENYIINNWSGSIVKKELTNISMTKVYDGDNTFSFTATSDNGVVNDEVVSYIFTADDKNVSSVEKKVLVNFESTTPETSKNYTFKLKDVTAIITKKPLTNITYSHAFNTSKNIATGNLTTENGVIGEDQVAVTGKFTTAYVGAEIESLKLSGANASNYSIAISDVNASITKNVVENINYLNDAQRNKFLATCLCGENYDIMKYTLKPVNIYTYIYTYLNLQTWVDKNDISITYYDSTDTLKESPLASKPTIAGTYTLVLTVADSDNYTGDSFETTYTVNHNLNEIGSCSCGHDESVEITLTENTGSTTQNFTANETYYFKASFVEGTVYTISLSGEFGTISVLDSTGNAVNSDNDTYTFSTADTYYIIVSCTTAQENGTLSINI